MSQDTFNYERSLSAKSYIYTSSDSDSDSVPESPSSVVTNFSVALSADSTATLRSLPLTHSSLLPAQEADSLRIPTLLHAGTITGNNHADAIVTRQSSSHTPSAPSNKMRSRTLSTSPDSESSGSDTVTFEDASTARERPVRQRVTSLGTRTRDSTVLYPSDTTYLYASGKGSERQPTDVTMPARPGSEIPKPTVPYTSNDTRGHTVAFSRQNQLESRDGLLPYPPGLERYPQNLQSISTGPTNSVPYRRRSDGDQAPTSTTAPADSMRPSSAPPTRGVRWNENLICPSPILASQRRKGWYNRRG
jgi:hypothetical protein